MSREVVQDRQKRLSLLIVRGSSSQSHTIRAPLYQSIIAFPPAPDYLYLCMATEKKAKAVAVVDDDESVRSALQGLLKATGIPAVVFASAEEFLSSGQQWRTACLIADIRLPGISGLDLQSRLNADRCKIPTIFVTAQGDERMRMQALRAGAVEFLIKPFDVEALLGCVRAALVS